METITSLQNPRIKNLVLLQQKSRERGKQNLVVVEGLRETYIALKAGFNLKEAYLCPEIALNRETAFNKEIALNKEAFNSNVTSKNTGHLKEQASDKGAGINKDASFNNNSILGGTSTNPVVPGIEENKMFMISRPVFEKLAYREGSDGFIALFEPKKFSLNNIKLSNHPLVIILESVEKPGNLGAILRTADAADVDAVIICDPLTDIYNPNVIRSSIGCVFSRQVVTCTSEEAQQWLRDNGITSYAAELKASSAYYKYDYSEGVAFVMGTEADGLTDKWVSFCDHRIIIPMLGSIDSLNVSVSTAVLVFEAMRQRGFNKA